MEKLLLVVGMYRSGTSAITQALTKLGYYPGAEKDLPTGDESNRDGYWENRQIMALNNRIAAQFGMTDFTCQSLPERWEQFPAANALMQHGRSLIHSLYGNRPFAGWKDPRTSRLLPFYSRLFEVARIEPYFLLPVRNPVQVARSLQARDFIDFESGLGLWTHYNLTCLALAPYGSTLVVSHSGVLKDAETGLRPIFELFGFPTPDDLNWAVVQDCFRNDLVRQQETGMSDVANPITRSVWQTLNQIIDDPDGYREGSFVQKIQTLWEQWQMWTKSVQPYHTPASTVALTGTSSDFARIPACRWNLVRLTAAGRGALTLSMGSMGIAYLKSPKLIDADGRSRDFQFQPGPDCYSERIGQDLHRFVLITAGRHLLLKMPDEPGTWTLEFEIFTQTGLGYAHASYQAILRTIGSRSG